MTSNQELKKAMLRSWMRIIFLFKKPEQREKHKIRKPRGMPRKNSNTGMLGIPSEGVRGEMSPIHK